MNTKFLEKSKHLPKPLFASLFWNSFFGILPFGLLLAVASLIGKLPFNNDGVEHYGIVGFLLAILWTFFMVIIFAVNAWIILFIGNKIIQLITNSGDK